MVPRAAFRVVPLSLAMLLAGCFAAPAEPPAPEEPMEPEAATDCGPPPTYTRDPTWPPLLPGGWSLGNIAGIGVGPDDNVWIFQRSGVNAGDGGVGGVGTGPPVIQFDPQGNVLRGWGGPGAGYDWPDTEHGIGVDGEGNVWLTGNGAADHMLLKFSPEGAFLLQIGGRGVSQGSNDVESVRQAADVAADASEIFVADGYGNKRVIAFSLNGTYLRHWGAYGNEPDDSVNDPSQQFGQPLHGITLAHDGTVFVGDRDNGRIQSFARNGTFLQEYRIPGPAANAPKAFDAALISPEQEYFVWADGWLANGSDRVVFVCRANGEVGGEFQGTIHPDVGGPGLPFVPGQVTTLHSIAADSKGNIYLADMFHGGSGGNVHKLLRAA